MNAGGVLWNGFTDKNDRAALKALLSADPDVLFDEDDYLEHYIELEVRWRILHQPNPIPQGRFSLDHVDPQVAYDCFRFEPANIVALAHFFFGARDKLETPNRYACTPVEATAMLLRVLARAVDQDSLIPEFFCSPSRISAITTYFGQRIAARIRDFMCCLDIDDIQENAEEWTEAMERVVGYETGVFAAADVKDWEIDSFSVRGVFYDGHKHCDALKFLTVMAPNGLTIAAYGPHVGRRHDMIVFRAADWAGDLHQLWQWGLQNHPANYDGQQRGLAVVMDSAFARSPGVFVLHKRNQHLNAHLLPVEHGLREARAEIEHSYAAQASNWRGLAKPFEIKVGLRPIGAYVWLVIFLENCRICAKGLSQVATKFRCAAPSLTDYLRYCADRERHLVPQNLVQYNHSF